MLSGAESLTPRERRVGELAAKGLTTRAIAELLFVTPKTVEFHLRHVYQKLDITSRSEIADALGEGRSELALALTEAAGAPREVAALDHAVDQPVCQRLLAGEVAVALHIGVDALD